MALLNKRLPENVPGEFFVDSTCIDCDTCRQLAPEVFAESDSYSYVYLQPQTEREERNALRALLACPTGSIGTLHSNQAREVKADFPLHLENGVYYSGFNSPKSYGGNSYLVRHPDGNWLIDSPKFLPQLVARFEELGGIRNIFLTHQDDVAEAQKYAQRFSSTRIIHRQELPSQPGSEIVLDGQEPIELSPEFLAIPTPGHTRGHCCLLHRGFLFTGDHLWWSRNSGRLNASKQVCWYSWPEQTRSMAVLCNYQFEWVLPGHGQRVKLPSEVMQQELLELVKRMRNR